MVLSEKVGFSEKVAVGLIEKIRPSEKVGPSENESNWLLLGTQKFLFNL